MDELLPPTGALLQNGTCTFNLWAPEKKKIDLHIIQPFPRKVAMEKGVDGFWTVTLPIPAGSRYKYSVDDEEQSYPDPGSFYQPEGVHGPSEIIDHNYHWQCAHWSGLPLRDMVIYEIHVGSFTEAGTFEAIIPRLKDLFELGINAIELMPVAQFPGQRNWGYDGVYPFAVQHSYGGPHGLKKLVDECHRLGMAILLDVVYNHFGPEGNYHTHFGPFLTDKYCTPWGQALNLDGAWSDGVRSYLCHNILYWFEVFRIDGLRFDAIHTIYDFGAINFWELVQQQVKQLERRLARKFYLIAESDLNSPRVVEPVAVGGFGFDAQWLDDFHHALYSLLADEGNTRYIDFGALNQLAKAYTDGFVHSGEYVSFRKRKHGKSSAGVSGDKFVVFNQNHDQVGNRVKGERISRLMDFERQKVAAAAILLAPYIPMLFMGEEYGEDVPFFYFVSHSDPKLIEAVREGRKKEFESYGCQEGTPDPQDEATLRRSVLQWDKRSKSQYKLLLDWHKRLLETRKSHAAFQNFDKQDITAQAIAEKALIIYRWSANGRESSACVFNFSDKPVRYTLPKGNEWSLLLSSGTNERVVNNSPDDFQDPDNISLLLTRYEVVLWYCVRQI